MVMFLRETGSRVVENDFRQTCIALSKKKCKHDNSVFISTHSNRMLEKHSEHLINSELNLF